MEEDCVILDIPDGLRLNLLGLVVQIDRVSITADRAGLLGGLLASLTCGGAAAADQLDALAQMVRAREIAPEESAQDEEQETEEEPAQDEEQETEEEPAEDEEQETEDEPAEDEEQETEDEPAEDEEQEPARPSRRRTRGGGRRA